MSLISHFKIDLYGSCCITYLNQIHALYTNNDKLTIPPNFEKRIFAKNGTRVPDFK